MSFFKLGEFAPRSFPVTFKCKLCKAKKGILCLFNINVQFYFLSGLFPKFLSCFQDSEVFEIRLKLLEAKGLVIRLSPKQTNTTTKVKIS